MGDSEIVAVGDTAAVPVTGAPEAVKTVEKEESPEAMFKLAQMLHEGTDDMKADVSRAVCLYQSALEQGYMAARAPLLEILAATPAATPEELANAKEFMGITDDVDADDEPADEGTAMVEEAASLEISDPEKAKELYNTAIQEYDDPDAMNGLAILLEKSDAKRSVELYTTAMNNHAHCEAMFNLAVLLGKGGEGVAPDAKKAVELYEKVIEEEADTDAMNNLAELLQVGAEGVSADKKRAEFLFNEAKSLAHEPMEDDDDDEDEEGDAKDAEDEMADEGEKKEEGK